MNIIMAPSWPARIAIVALFIAFIPLLVVVTALAGTLGLVVLAGWGIADAAGMIRRLLPRDRELEADRVQEAWEEIVRNYPMECRDASHDVLYDGMPETEERQ